MKLLVALMAVLVVGGGTMMGMGQAQDEAAAQTLAGGMSCVLPPGQGLPADGPWPDTLNAVHVAQVAAAAGFTGQDLTIAVAVAYAESSHRPHLTNQNTDKHRSVDYGLWQINAYWHPDEMKMGDWGSPWTNARMAHSIWSQPGKHGRWNSWVTYKRGLHTKHMGTAAAAVAQLTELGTAAGTCVPGPAGSGGAALPEGPASCAQVTGAVQSNQTATVRHQRGSTTVHRCLAPNIQALFVAAHQAGIPLGGGGYRDPAGQLRVRRNNCGTSHYAIYEMPSKQCRPPTAKPGSSMHERGLAIDFTCSGAGSVRKGDVCSRWLLAHSQKFGIQNWPVEPWH